MKKISSLALMVTIACMTFSFGIHSVSGATAESHKVSTGEEPSPVGCWRSVDFVDKVESFVAGQKKFSGDLFLKEFSVFPGGMTSVGFTWEKGNISGIFKSVSYVTPYYVQAASDSTYLFLPWLPSMEGGKAPCYYVLKRISDQPRTVKPGPRNILPVSVVKDYQDVSWKDVSSLDLAGRSGLLRTLSFNEKTVWPESSKLPVGEDPQKIMGDGMNPGLGIRDLHRQGITGKGVSVAIIDKPLYQDHPEYRGKFAAYYNWGCPTESSQTGPFVASLLVGEKCGTAPGAKLYYAATPYNSFDAMYYARALDWIIEQNKMLSPTEKIRVVSVSEAPSSSSLFKNQAMWDEACARAEANGILVLDLTRDRGFISLCYYDSGDPENVTKCRNGAPGRGSALGEIPGTIFVPSSLRTMGEELTEGDCSYIYYGVGAPIWAIPYCAGVLAMGWQIKPELTPQQMKDLLFQSAYTDSVGNKIIDPQEFIRMVSSTATEVKESNSIRQFRLHAPYPNPFNPSTVISYELPEKTMITLKVFNLSGQVVKTLVDGAVEKGQHRIEWDGTNDSGKKTASGIYFFRLKAGDFSQTRKITLLR